MKRGFGRLIIPIRLLCLIILVASGLPRIVLAAPVINESFTTPLSATPVPITSDDSFSTADLTKLLTALDPSGPRHFGPYPSSSEDSGTCNNNWADDTFDRHFTVTQTGNTITVVEQFEEGTFVTPSTTPPNPSQPNNQSPGACNTASPPFGDGGKVNDGITGEFHGFFIIPVAFPQSSFDPHCDALLMTDANCTTATFINTHFAGCAYPAPPCAVTTFFFHYTAEDQGLVMTDWKNASNDKGGNQGDIRSGPVACPPGDEEESNQQQDQELCEH